MSTLDLNLGRGLDCKHQALDLNTGYALDSNSSYTRDIDAATDPTWARTSDAYDVTKALLYQTRVCYSGLEGSATLKLYSKPAQ